MKAVQAAMTALLCVFYTAYLTKMFLLKKQGITGNLLGKGDKPKSALVVELCLRMVTLVGVIIQLGSVLFVKPVGYVSSNYTLQITGLILAFAGNVLFIAAISTMKNNWRAGFDRVQDTQLVTGGVYRISRNPAFTGFDLLYLGCALAFPNVANIAAAMMAVLLFHIQILGEERFLEAAFGQSYVAYKARVRRYLGTRCNVNRLRPPENHGRTQFAPTQAFSRRGKLCSPADNRNALYNNCTTNRPKRERHNG